jgi:hypothetical protein
LNYVKGELFQEIIDLGPFNEKYSTHFIFQIISAINYCHKMKIILKWNAKSKNSRFWYFEKLVEKGHVQRKLIESNYYIAPEVLKKHYIFGKIKKAYNTKLRNKKALKLI